MISAIIHRIDIINEWMGKIAGLLVIPMVFISVMDVILRYAFDNPTVWAWDVNVQILGALVALGGGYALLHNTHVSVDLLVSRLLPKRRALVDITTFPIFLTCFVLLLWRVAIDAGQSVLAMEVSISSWGPPVYPLKMAIVLGITAMIFQGIAHFMRNLCIVLRR